MAHFIDPAVAYSDDDPRQVGDLEPSPVPDYIESGDTVWPNFLGATERDIAAADEGTDTNVEPRSQPREGNAAGRLVDDVAPNVNVSVPSGGDIRGLVVLLGAFALALVGLNAFARGAGQGAVS